MFFRNITLFRFNAAAAKAFDHDFDPLLANHCLKPCPSTSKETFGWASPFSPYDEEAAIFHHRIGHFVLLCLGREERVLPPAVINAEVNKQAASLEKKKNKPLGGKSRTRLREEIIQTLLPKAFIRPSRFLGYLDLKNGWLLIDSVSKRIVDAYVGLLRETLPDFSALPLDPQESPRAVMTQWLRADLPKNVNFGDECEFQDPENTRATIRCKSQIIDSKEIKAHLVKGNQLSKLSLFMEDKVSFLLSEDLTVRKLRLLDIIIDELEKDRADNIEQELDARFALLSLTMQPVLDWIERSFKTPRPGQKKR